MLKKNLQLNYIKDGSMAVINHFPVAMHLILWGTLLAVSFLLIWSNFAVLDEITRGEGKVVPSRTLQVVQNLEGGIISKIKVEEGDIVTKGQVLMEIDDTRFSSSLNESRVSSHALKIKMLRLLAEAQNSEFEVSDELTREDPRRVKLEQELYMSRKKELHTKLSIIRDQRIQKEQELGEVKNRKQQLEKNLTLLQEELAMTKPLVSEGAVSQVDLLHLERSVNDTESEIKSAAINIVKLKISVEELIKRYSELELNFKTESMAEFNLTRNELTRLAEGIVDIEDKVDRTQVRSPVNGVVNQIKHKTEGGIVQPGQDLIDIVPLDDSLLVEAKIKPSDIGFLYPGLPAKVKITAYDFAIYGGLDAKVESISADAISKENGESYYKVMVRTESNKLIYKGKELGIISGMGASVDIITGHKSVLDYILKPLIKTKQNALTER